MAKVNKKKVQEIVIQAAIELARKDEGALFVIGDKIKYDLMLKQKIVRFNVFDEGARKLLVSLGTLDGAVIINNEGEITAYGVMIKKAKPYMGYGTRHAAAFTASQSNNISVLASEEERKVKIFKNGKFVLQLDALQKNIEKEIPQVTTLLESIGVGFLGIVGVTVIAPALGIALLPGVIVLGASYYAIKEMFSHLKKK